MPYFDKRYHPPGTSPGTLIDSGETPSPARIRLVTFNARDYSQEDDVDPETCCLRAQPGENIAEDAERFAWIHVQGPASSDLLTRLRQIFGLHPLAVEDVLNTGQRPKFDIFDDQLFATLNVPHFHARQARATQVSLFLGKRFVITFCPNTEDPFAPVLRSLCKENTRIRSLGIDYLFYALIDVIIDTGFPLIESFGNAVEEIEEETLYDASNKTALRIHELRRELLLAKKMLWPHRELLNAMMHDDNELIGDQARLYLRDCYDHSIQLMDMLETYRDMTTGILDVYLTSISTRMNEVMKVLTIIATIFIPLTFVAGVYGMNFGDNKQSPWAMPELGWYYGYPLSLLLMAIIAIGMLIYFKRKNWF